MRYAGAALNREIRFCTCCPLHKQCKAPVPGDGDLNAPLFIIGQSPGAQEDQVGKPFIGPSGQLLRDTLRDFGVDEFYVTNGVKCHPVGNRAARRAEVEACSPWLDAELDLSSAKAVLILGAEALRGIFPKAKFPELRAKAPPQLERDGVPVWVGLHPAAVLRNPGLTPKFRELIRALSESLGCTAQLVPEGCTYILAQNAVECEDLWATIWSESPRFLALDTEFVESEGGSPPRLLGWSVAWGANRAAYIPHGDAGRNLLRALIFHPQVQHVDLILHSCQADIPVIQHYLDQKTCAASWPWDRTHDTCVAAYVLREPAVGLKILAWKYLGRELKGFESVVRGYASFDMLSLEEQAAYAAADADCTWLLWDQVFHAKVTAQVKAQAKVVSHAKQGFQDV